MQSNAPNVMGVLTAY